MSRVDETHQTLLSGTGETHLAVACERLHRKFGVDVDIEEVKVPYRETITKEADAEGKYKKQTGGHGQYGVANVRISPLGRGEGFRFVDQVVGGAIPRQYIPAVEKGIAEAMGMGGVYGFPVVDVEVACYDGKFHSVDSSEMSFKMAGSLAFREAMAKAAPVLLEPISQDRDNCAAEHAGRRARRPQLEPWPGAGNGHLGKRRAMHHRPGPHRRDPALRDRPAVPDRWKGPVPRGARPLRHGAGQLGRPARQGQSRLKLKLDLHDIYNKGHDIDRALADIMQEAARTKASLVEIIPGKGSGQLKKRVIRYLDKPEVKVLYHRVEKDSRNFGRIFVHFRWK